MARPACTRAAERGVEADSTSLRRVSGGPERGVGDDALLHDLDHPVGQARLVAGRDERLEAIDRADDPVGIERPGAHRADDPLGGRRTRLLIAVEELLAELLA